MQSALAKAPRPKNEQAAHPVSLRVLLVSPSLSERESLKGMLCYGESGANCVFEEMASGTDALRCMSQQPYDCVLIDEDLPDMSGIDLLKKTRHPDNLYAQSPCVLMAQREKANLLLEALREGADDFILKGAASPDVLNISLKKAREVFEIKRGLKQASEQLHTSRKMQAIGQLASGVAHDFNNLLTVVLGNTHLLRRRVNNGLENCDPEDLAGKIRAIDAAAVKGADLVRRLMVFARQSPLLSETININECIEETFELLRRALGENIDIQMILAPDPWLVSLDTGEFENVMINFAINARDAMPEGGRLTIETSNVILDEYYGMIHPEVTPGPYVMIAVSDTGCGMEPRVAKRVFEPFFTTKPVGDGTGLGMSMAYGFVRQCGGHIHLYSEPGHGTVFRIYLPRVSGGAALIDDASAPRGGENVLVVEDDEVSREIAVKMLEKLGYCTLQAATGRVALEMLRAEGPAIDALFTDIVLPGDMNGFDLARRARELYPDIKVLYTSGYSENALPEYQLGIGEVLISKPYRKSSLAEKMRGVMEKVA